MFGIIKVHSQSKEVSCSKLQDMAKSDHLAQSKQSGLENRLSRK